MGLGACRLYRCSALACVSSAAGTRLGRDQAIFFLNTPAHGAFGAPAACTAAALLRAASAAAHIRARPVGCWQLRVITTIPLNGGLVVGTAGPFVSLPLFEHRRVDACSVPWLAVCVDMRVPRGGLDPCFGGLRVLGPVSAAVCIRLGQLNVPRGFRAPLWTIGWGRPTTAGARGH